MRLGAMGSKGGFGAAGYLGGATAPAGFVFILDSDGNRILGSDGNYILGVAF